MLQLESLSLEDAREILRRGEAKAQEIKSPSNIAVVDAGGNLITHIRMDGAWIGSIDISINKAYTSRAFDIATKDLAALSQPGKPFFGIMETNHSRVVIFAGGVPIRKSGKVVGAVGVSGGTGDQDQTVAEAAAAVFTS